KTRDLLGERLVVLAKYIAVVDDGEAGKAVDKFLAALSTDVHSLGPLDHELFISKPGMIMSLVGPEVPDRVAARRHGWPPLCGPMLSSRACSSSASMSGARSPI